MSNGLKQDISIGKNLRRLRKEAGFTQERASAKLELMGLPMTPEIMAKIEQGRYSVKISVLFALKEIYQVGTFDAFFEGLSLEQARLFPDGAPSKDKNPVRGSMSEIEGDCVSSGD